jgi:hypothetical protein
MMKAIRMRSPFQHEISNPSEHQRRFERMTMTLPSLTRPVRRPACLASSMLFWRMNGSPALASSLFARAVMRR